METRFVRSLRGTFPNTHSDAVPSSRSSISCFSTGLSYYLFAGRAAIASESPGFKPTIPPCLASARERSPQAFLYPARVGRRASRVPLHSAAEPSPTCRFPRGHKSLPSPDRRALPAFLVPTQLCEADSWNLRPRHSPSAPFPSPWRRSTEPCAAPSLPPRGATARRPPAGNPYRSCSVDCLLACLPGREFPLPASSVIGSQSGKAAIQGQRNSAVCRTPTTTIFRDISRARVPSPIRGVPRMLASAQGGGGAPGGGAPRAGAAVPVGSRRCSGFQAGTGRSGWMWGCALRKAPPVSLSRLPPRTPSSSLLPLLRPRQGEPGAALPSFPRSCSGGRTTKLAPSKGGGHSVWLERSPAGWSEV